MTTKNRKTCAQGHVYFKSSDCPTCPVCEAERKPKEGFFSLLPSPARRALTTHGITSPQQLAMYSEKEILFLHGIGPSSLPILRRVLKTENLAFKKK